MFRKVYSIELQDLDQPLLVHRPKDKELQRVSEKFSLMEGFGTKVMVAFFFFFFYKCSKLTKFWHCCLKE